MSTDYKTGKTFCEVWAYSMARFIESASSISNPLAKMIEYKTSIVTGAFSPQVPRGVEFTDRTIRRTHQIIMVRLPIWQRELLIEYLFSEDKQRETADIRAIYSRVGRELREWE